MDFWSVVKHIREHALTGAPAHAHNRVARTMVASVLHDGGVKDCEIFTTPAGGARVSAVKLVSETAISANATDKWLVDVHNPTDSVSLIAAQASTANTAIAAYTPWSVGAISNGTLQEGDVMVGALTGAGSVAVLGNTTWLVFWS